MRIVLLALATEARIETAAAERLSGSTPRLHAHKSASQWQGESVKLGASKVYPLPPPPPPLRSETRDFKEPPFSHKSVRLVP